MIQLLAQGAILVAAGWLCCASLVMAIAPRLARQTIAVMGSTPRIHFGEHLLRGIVGAAMIVRASNAKAPALLEIGGWFVLLSSILIMIAPRGWHHAYAKWWADRIPLWAYRLNSLPTLFFAGLVAYLSL